jgi:hypothetical protein
MKRVVDFPRLYDSAKLASLQSDELRAEYLWLLGIVGPHGSFEWSVRRLWAAAYAPIREKTESQVAEYLEAFLVAGLLIRWDQDGKTWGYFVGSDLPGRLPRTTYAVEATGNVFAVADAMGHQDLKTTRIYQHPELGAIRDAIDERNNRRIM